MTNGKSNSSQYVFKFLNLLERQLAKAQGKGYGTATIYQEVNLVCQMLKRSAKLAIDMGANVGEYTAELRRRNPSLEIHMFEPSLANIDKLTTRFRDDVNIKLVPFAVSNVSGEAVLYSNEPGSGMGSLTKRKLEHFGLDFDFNEKIKTIKFEEYWASKLNKRTIDIVKIDIEGHEFDALNGFGDALQATSVLQFEFGGCNIDTRTYFQDFWYFFEENNFEIYRVTPFGLEKIQRYRESDEFFVTTNYIAANCRGK